MPAIQPSDLNNAKVDVDHIADVATSTAPTATDRKGGVKRTLVGVIAYIQMLGEAAVAAFSAAADALLANLNSAAAITETGQNRAAVAADRVAAQLAAATAEAARDSLNTTGKVFTASEGDAAGIAATTNGQQFSVLAADLYSFRITRNNAGSPLQLESVRTKAWQDIVPMLRETTWLHADALLLSGASSARPWSPAATMLARAIKRVIFDSGADPAQTYAIGVFARDDTSVKDNIVINTAAGAAWAGNANAEVTEAANGLTEVVLRTGTNRARLLIDYREITGTGVLLNLPSTSPLIISRDAAALESRKADTAQTMRPRNLAFDPTLAASGVGSVFQTNSGVLTYVNAPTEMAARGVVKAIQFGGAVATTILYKRESGFPRLSEQWLYASAEVEADDGVTWPLLSTYSPYYYLSSGGGAQVPPANDITRDFEQLAPTLRLYACWVKLPANALINSVASGFDAKPPGAVKVGGFTLCVSESMTTLANAPRNDWSGYKARDGWKDEKDSQITALNSSLSAAANYSYYNIANAPILSPGDTALFAPAGANPVYATPFSPNFIARGIDRAWEIGDGRASGMTALYKREVLGPNSSGRYYFLAWNIASQSGAAWPTQQAFLYSNADAYITELPAPAFVQLTAIDRQYWTFGQHPTRSDLGGIRYGSSSVVTGSKVQMSGFTYVEFTAPLTLANVKSDDWYGLYGNPKQVAQAAKIVSTSFSLAGRVIAMAGDSITAAYGVPEQLAARTGATVLNMAIPGSRWAVIASATGIEASRNDLSLVRLAEAIRTGNWAPAIAAAAAIFAAAPAEDYRARVDAMAAQDWSKVDAMTAAGATNDFAGGRAIGAIGSTDETQVNGAINLFVERILGVYPRMQLMLVTPMWRGPAAAFGDSNTGVNGISLLLSAYQDAIGERGRWYQIPVHKQHEVLGINLRNKALLLSDDLHLTVPAGRDRVVDKYIGFLRAQLT